MLDGLMNFLRIRLSLLLAAVLCLASCATQERSEGDTTTVNDDYGRTVQVPVSPTRIVSTSPAVTEIIFALGAEDLLVGRTDFCTYPPQAINIESIGGISNLNNEKILTLNPDLVISGSMIPKKNTDQLAQMGVPTVCVIEQHRFDGLYDNIAKIGNLIGRPETADSLVLHLQKEIMELPRPDDGDRPSVYYVVGFGSSGNFTAGGDSFINDIITMAGGRNIAANMEGWSFSLESLMQSDPDYIIIRKEDAATFCHTSPYDRLSAVKEGRVIAIESGMIDLQVPRNIEAVKIISQSLSTQVHD